MRVVAGIMLIAYVAAIVVVQELGTKSLIDADAVHALQSTLDLPTWLVLVVFTLLTVRLELFKPKYKLPVKSRPLYDSILFVVGLLVIVVMLVLRFG